MKPRHTALCIVLASACGPGSQPIADAAADAPTAALHDRVFVSASDYSTGALCALSRPDLAAASNIAPLSGDSVLAWHGRTLIAMNLDPAGEDDLTMFNVAVTPPALGCSIAMHQRDEHGAGNARGYVAVDAVRGYVARFGQPTLAIVDTRACTITGLIDLAPYRGNAPLPGARSIAMVRGMAWVTLDRLPPGLTNPTEPGAIAVIDPAHDAVIDAAPQTPGTRVIALHHPNPVGHLGARGSSVAVACVGAYQTVGDGAVEAIDAASMRWSRDLVTETEVNGNIDAALPLDDDRLLLRVVSAAVGSGLAVDESKLVEWRISTRVVLNVWLRTPGYALTEPILGRDGRVYVGDRGDEPSHRAAGVRVFDATSGAEVTPAPISCGLQPYDLAEEPAS